MNTCIDRIWRSMRPRCQGWLVVAVAMAWLVGVPAAPGCSIRRTGTAHVSPNSKTQLKYEKHSTPAEVCLHHGLTAVKTTSNHIGVSTKVHLASTSNLPKSAILAHHQVHKTQAPVHIEASEKGEKPDKDDLVKTVTTPPCVTKTKTTAAGYVTPPVVTPSTSHSVPEPTGLVIASLLAGAGLIARRRLFARRSPV